MRKSLGMKGFRNGLVLVFSLLWMSGCSTIAVKTDFDPESDFSRYKTYGWMAQAVGDDIQMAAIRKEVGPWIESDVEKELNARGFTRKTEGRPDFFLAYYGQLENIIEANYVTYGCGARICSGGMEFQEYTQGTMILDVIDAEKNEVVWRGTSAGPVADRDKRRKRIEERVQAMLKDFPPR